MPRPRLTVLDRALRGTIVTEAASLREAGHDGSHLVGRPLAVVRPRDVRDVVTLVRWARRHRVPVVARGAGTSLDGESVPTDGSIAIDFGGWNAIREISGEGRWARVQPGVVNADLQAAVRPHGLFYPPNPGSSRTCTVGGNVGTNASGPRSLRYGATRRWVKELEVVLGTGACLHVGSRAEKRSVGPDLLNLFIGSEGTLGITTEVTVRLAPLPRVRSGLIVPLRPRTLLGPLALRLTRASDTGLSALEYLDRYSARGLSEDRDAPWDAEAPLVLLEIEAADSREAARRTVRVQQLLRQHGGTLRARVYPDAERLWDLRGESSRVMDDRLGHRVREDIAVPLPAVDRMIRALHAIAAKEGVPMYLFAHLGEGSLHPNFVLDPASPVAERIRGALYAASLRLGGTISAEHGIGRLKRRFLAREIGEEGVRLLRAVRAACDPDGILNPGKLYPPERAAEGSFRSPSGSGGA